MPAARTVNGGTLELARAAQNWRLNLGGAISSRERMVSMPAGYR